MPIYLRDLNAVGDLLKTWELFKLFIPYLVFICVVIIVTIFLGVKFERKENNNLFSIYAVTPVFLIFITSYFYNTEIRLLLYKHGVFDKKNANLIRRGLKYGYLTNFTQAAFFINQQKKPTNYNKAKIKSIVAKYDLNNVTSNQKQKKPDNIIIVFTEAFTNPADFGWKLSEEPLPNFKNIIDSGISGQIISPVFGGKSVNSEFEFMTGLTNRFTPIESSPYLEFVNKEIPSLSRTLSSNGYTTNAIQVIKFSGFGYGKIYDYLGVDNKVSLHKKNNPNYKLDPSNKTVSSHEIAKKIIQLTHEQEKSFIFSFPNSSHSPWKIEDYTNTNIQLMNKLDDKYKADEITAYINSLNHIDKLLKILIEEFDGSIEKTMIVILGDHQPSIDLYTKHYKENDKLSDYTNLILKKYTVPIGIWTNYNTGSSNEELLLSMNLLPSYILDFAAVDYKGLMKFNSIIREKLHVISQIIKNKKGSFFNRIPEEYLKIISEYELLQYDILFGDFFLKDLIKHK